MSDNYELYRSAVASHLMDKVPPSILAEMMSVIDGIASDYEITKKPMAIIQSDGIPEAVRFFLCSKAVENLSSGSLKQYKLRLMDFFAKLGKPLKDVTTNDIRMYLFYYKSQRQAADSYLDNIRRVLNSFFTWSVTNEYLTKNPCAKVEHIKYQEKEREPLSAYDLELLRWHCETIREKALIDFFFATGVRLCECRAVNKSDIDWNRRSVVILHGKGNKRRTVFFNAESELSLRKYLESRTDSEDALFVGLRKPHGRLSPKAVENIITKVANRAGLHVYPHKLRHTFATSGLRGGMPLEKLQSLMGHAEPRTTMIYAKMDVSDLQRDHQRIFA